MTDETLFKKEETPAVTPAIIPSVNDFDDKLSLIVNENGEKKYDTVDVALGALAQSQVHIPKLEKENAAIRTELDKVNAELAKRASIEDVVSKLAPGKQEPVSVTPDATVLDQGVIEQLVRTVMSGDAEKATLEQNAKYVSVQLTEVYGEKTEEVVTAKAAELGLTFDQYAELSRKSPKVALAMFNQTAPSASGTTTSTITPISQPSPSTEVKAPKKSILQGSTTAEQMAHFAEHKRAVYAKHGVVE